MFAEAHAWLGRLVGRFEVEVKDSTVGGVRKQPGTAVCSHIGSGPGVQCVIQYFWTPPAPGFEYLSPEIDFRRPRKDAFPLLFLGINPETLEIQLVLVGLELVAARSGVLTGDTVDFADNWNVCYPVLTNRWMAAAVTVRAAGEIVIKLSDDQCGIGRKNPLTMKSGYTSDLELRLRRERQVDTNGSEQAL